MIYLITNTADMIYKIFKPIPALNDIVDHFWYSKIELNSAIIQHYPTPLLQGLVFNFTQKEEHHAYRNEVVSLYKNAYIFGQPICPRVITTHHQGVDILGVKFKPLGITRVSGINMEYMADKIIAAEDVWGNEVESLCDEMQSAPQLEDSIKVLERFLLHKYFSTRLHYRVENVENSLLLMEQSYGQISVRDIQMLTNTSRKTLERAFLNYVGLTPKLYASIVRFNAVKERIDKGVKWEPITNIALEGGYFDSSHFAAEFKRFSSLTPKEYIQNITQHHPEWV